VSDSALFLFAFIAVLRASFSNVRVDRAHVLCYSQALALIRGLGLLFGVGVACGAVFAPKMITIFKGERESVCLSSLSTCPWLLLS
jgi:hypothetical protein